MHKEPHRSIPPQTLFRVCEMFIEGKGATQIAKWLTEAGYARSRQEIYPLLDEGRQRGFLRLQAPPEIALGRRVAEAYPVGDISVLNVRDPQTITDHLTSTAADLTLSLIKELGRTKNSVHVGLGGGDTVRRVARALGVRLTADPDVPDLVLHALNSGFDVYHPISAPVTFFSFFSDVPKGVKFVGLFAEAIVRCADYEAIKALPGVRESFQEAANIDIVITSLARPESHSQLRRFMALGPEQGFRNLEQSGWVGDVMWRPYSKDGPITVDTGIRAVTIFELSDLVKLAQTPGKHVILCAGPCNFCGAAKVEAVRPLLSQPSLRVANHVIMDFATATGLLEAR